MEDNREMIEEKAAKREDSSADVFGKVQRLLSPRERRLNVSFEPFSAIIMDKLSRIADRRERVRLFEEILNDSRTQLHYQAGNGAKTTIFIGNKGPKTDSWAATKKMAEQLNEAGRSVCFLPEYDNGTSADAIIQFNKKQWRLADLKHSGTDNYNTIATDLEK